MAEAGSPSPAPAFDRERAEREREAYDEHDVAEVNVAWHSRFRHVFASPNILAIRKPLSAA